jgi:polysaccharide deacetylase family protein (PEP-CTERM system associated)
MTAYSAGVEAGAAERFDGFLLSFDLEDWHQLVRRRAGAERWDVTHPAFGRQVHTILDFLDGLGVRATFFVLGMTARNYPELVSEIAARGHEIASHGTAHARVHTQTRDEFRRDLEESVALIESLCGRRPVGYRAPAFSINRDTPWAYDVLGELGFRYDSSQYDSPRVPRRIEGIPGDAYRLRLDSGSELLEFPIAVWRAGGRALPIGGGGYWRAFPDSLLLRALRGVKRASAYPVLYFHPYEFDPEPLRPELPRSAGAKQRLKAASRSVYRNPGRRRTIRQLARVAREFPLSTYESILGHDALGRGGAKALSPGGAVV